MIVKLHAIPGYSGYFASRDGQIWSTKRPGNQPRDGRARPPRLMKPAFDGQGYPFVEVGDHNGKRVLRKIHLLILETFRGPRPEGMVGCHWDGNVKNSCVDNLRWDTRVANEADKLRHGTRARGEKLARKLNSTQVLKIVDLVRSGERHHEIASRFEIAPITVSLITSGSIWSHVTGIHTKADRVKSPAPKLTPEKVRQIIRYDSNGHNQRWIAEQFGIAPTTVSGIVNGRIWSHITGISNSRPNAKLTKPKVIQILAMLSKGMTHAAVAAEFGVTKSAIGCIARGQSWSHVTGITSH